MKKTILAIITLALFATGCKKTCETGYTGSSCTTEKTPTSMTITKIVVNGFDPTKTNGSYWDFSYGKADIYPNVYVGSLKIFDGATGYISSANYQSAYTFYFTTPITISYPTSTYSVILNDFDATSTDEVMGGLTFTPYTSGQKFPTTIQLTNPSTRISYTLSVTYNF